jgi:excisionase family DNA binding protein
MDSQFLGPLSGHDAIPRADAASLLLSADQLAHELSVSTRTISRLASSGKLPKPLRLGRSVRWRRDEVVSWLAAGCPDRQKWEAVRAKVERRKS